MYSLWANLYQKIPILAILWAVSPHFKSDIGEFSIRMRAWDSVLLAKFCKKNRLRGYTFQYGGRLTEFNGMSSQRHFGAN